MEGGERESHQKQTPNETLTEAHTRPTEWLAPHSTDWERSQQAAVCERSVGEGGV